MISTTSSRALISEKHSDRHIPQNCSGEEKSDQIKILHIISDLSIAGAETKLYKLLLATNRARFAPTVISLRDGAGWDLASKLCVCQFLVLA